MNNWFSALLRLVCLIEDLGADGFMDSLFIFRSKDFDSALEKAMTIGLDQEEEYFNGDKKRVRWVFKEVISLDQLPENLDGCEVYSQPTPLQPGESFSFTQKFDPRKSKPTQTI